MGVWIKTQNPSVPCWGHSSFHFLAHGWLIQAPTYWNPWFWCWNAKGGRCVLLQSKSVAPSFSLDYICTEGALMKTADTLGYLIRVWLSRQQAHLPEFIFFYLHMYKCLKNMEPSNLLLLFVKIFSLCLKHQVRKSIIIPVWCCNESLSCSLFYFSLIFRWFYVNSLDNFDMCLHGKKKRICNL